jgi:hypothetical protein
MKQTTPIFSFKTNSFLEYFDYNEQGDNEYFIKLVAKKNLLVQIKTGPDENNEKQPWTLVIPLTDGAVWAKDVTKE